MRRLRSAVADPVAAQRKEFERIVASGARTAFGREHAVEQGMGVEAFQQAVPVRDYEGLKPWIDRAVAGEADVVWPGRPM